MSDIGIYMDDYNETINNNNQLNDYEKNIIKNIDKKINQIKEYMCENEEGFHICLGIVSSTIMICTFGIIF